MSHLISVPDELFEKLTELKKEKKTSYSEVIRESVFGSREKTLTWYDAIARMEKIGQSFKGPKEKIDHDLIAYGVSRESA